MPLNCNDKTYLRCWLFVIESFFVSPFLKPISFSTISIFVILEDDFNGKG